MSNVAQFLFQFLSSLTVEACFFYKANPSTYSPKISKYVVVIE